MRFPWHQLPACVKRHIVAQYLGGAYHYLTLMTVEWRMQQLWAKPHVRQSVRNQVRRRILARDIVPMCNAEPHKCVARCARCSTWVTTTQRERGHLKIVNLAYMSANLKRDLAQNNPSTWPKMARRGWVYACANCSFQCAGCLNDRMAADLHAFGLCLWCNTRDTPSPFLRPYIWPRVSPVDGLPCGGCYGMPCDCRTAPAHLYTA